MNILSALFVALFLLAGCGNEQSLLQRPKVSLTNAQLKDVRTSGATAIFNLNIENPNPFGLTIKGVAYQLALNSRPKVLEGKLDSGISLPAQGSAPLSIPVAFGYQDVLLSVTDIIRDGGANYQLTGSVDTGIFTIPFQLSGKLTAR